MKKTRGQARECDTSDGTERRNGKRNDLISCYSAGCFSRILSFIPTQFVFLLRWVRRDPRPENVSRNGSRSRQKLNEVVRRFVGPRIWARSRYPWGILGTGNLSWDSINIYTYRTYSNNSDIFFFRKLKEVIEVWKRKEIERVEKLSPVHQTSFCIWFLHCTVILLIKFNY